MKRILWLLTPILALGEDPASAESPLVTGYAEAGYRWNAGVDGSLSTYRSIVDLGDGPRLLNFDLQFRNPRKRFADRASVRGNGWGGDPYSTVFADLSLEGRYRLAADYRDLAYYSLLPSFANPRIETGSLLSQNAYDTHRRLGNVHLELLPGHRLIPFFAYSRDSGYGTGVLNLVAENNEYPVASRYEDRTNNYRGGVRIESSRIHATLEQGGLGFKDDSGMFTLDPNIGNRTTPFLNQQLSLSKADRSYNAGGDSVYTRALMTANPVNWADIHAQFLFSQPSAALRYSEDATGRFVAVNRLLFFDRQLQSTTADAKQPHISGSLGMEVRPVSKVRLIESLLTDRLHNTSSGVLLDPLLATGSMSQSDRLELNYNRQEADVIWDAPWKLTLRGGHRFVWGDARFRGPLLSGQPAEGSRLRRHSALAAIGFRPLGKWSTTAEAEVGAGDDAYFRTSLYDFQKAKARLRYQALASLAISGQVSYLSNENPDPTIRLDQLFRTASAAAAWTPAGAKHLSFTAEYAWAGLRSDVVFREPQSLARELSRYRENSHSTTAVVDIRSIGRRLPALSLGGSLFQSAGSRPVRYYQPLVRASAPLHQRIHWVAEWRWYGFSEAFQTYEDFRSHQFVAGLRWTRE